MCKQHVIPDNTSCFANGWMTVMSLSEAPINRDACPLNKVIPESIPTLGLDWIEAHLLVGVLILFCRFFGSSDREVILPVPFYGDFKLDRFSDQTLVNNF